jgi:hypothetical protein
MSFRSPFAAVSGLLGSLSLRLGSAAVAFGLFSVFAVSATGCGGCDNATVACDAAGQNCVICDGYGCHPADPNATGTGGSGGSGGANPNTTATTGTGTPACDPAKTTCPCDATTKCEGGTQCLGGLCVAGCDFTYECGAAKVCVNGQCTPGCDDQTPCAAGYTCTVGACILDPSNPECGPTAPCAGGKPCVAGLCTSVCATNTDCPAGDICNSATGSCISDPSPKAGCSELVKCTGQNQQCGADGYCHYPCTTVTECKLYDSRFVACDQSICKTAEELEPECTIDNPCPAGKNCISNQCK